MRVSVKRPAWLGSVVALACVACSPAASPAAAAGDHAKVIAVKLGPDAFTVDKVGGGDGSVEPNGVPDAVLEANVEGPALGLILVAKDERDAPIAQWDTLTGKDTLPPNAGLYSTHGDTTAGMVVFEGGVRKTRTDGSLPPIAAGAHTLTIYVEIRDVPQLKKVELLLQRNDGSLVRGATMPLTLPVTPPS
ncbi:MAG: hypothetical protein JWM74_657 [Myxococcaceae bacterium]|nr:hypothetical protein [Myxococcaceae bacterium]